MPDPISQEDTTMDAIQFLKQEHQTAKAEFEKVLQASPKARGGLWEKLSPELEAHEQIEDACLYEPLSREAGGKDPKLAGWRQKHQDEVDEVEDLISEIESLAPEAEEWLTKVKEVHGSLEKHIQEEEGEIFPRISKVWDDARLKQAGTQMKEMKSKKADAA
jgi:iron-sulfur cluster repair protein YtfE (RIC family)